MQRAATTDDHHFLHAAWAQRFQRVVGDVGFCQHIGVGDEDARDVECDIAVADHDGPGARQVGRRLLKVWVCVVPAHEVDRGDAAPQLFAGDVQGSIRLGPDRIDHRVIAFGEFSGFDVFADGDVAEEAEPRVLGGLLELLADRLDFRVVRRDAGAHQTPWCRQHFQHVDTDVKFSASCAESAAFSSDAAAKNPDGPEPTIATW